MARYNAPEYDVSWLATVPVQKRGKGNPGGKSKTKYLDIVTAYDIETSRIPEIDQAYMYIWQWQLGPGVTVTGRTWEEYQAFCDRVEAAIPEDATMVVYVHNLSYEFHFLRNAWEWERDQVFATGPRRPLKATHGKLEFRCSYLHSNSSLSLYLSNMGVEHSKLEMDHTIQRWPWTVLTDEEMDYCCNDVEGLVEALTIEMEHDGDNLYTIPLTSTGYVRRDVKRAMHDIAYRVVKPVLPDIVLYKGLREAFRGGDTHANRYYTGAIINDVHSYDISSSYPSVQMCCKMPMSELKRQEFHDQADIEQLIYHRGKACLLHVALTDVKLSDPYWGCPYIAQHKCSNLLSPVLDNGRVVECDYLEMWITDVDYRILKDEYVWGDLYVIDCYSARYGPMPQPIRDVVLDYYVRKTSLKGVPGQAVNYVKSKNKLNSCYGMSAQDPAKESVLFDCLADSLWVADESSTVEGRLEHSYKTAVQPYQWGVWITAWARKRLHDAIAMVGDGFIYCDTDSVKYVGDVDWTPLNQVREEEAKAAGAFASDRKGVVHYMGVYEHDGEYSQFRTWGAKKYAYVEDGVLNATIAGVPKDVWDKDPVTGDRVLSRAGGGAELVAAGGIEAFRPGFIFSAGKLEAVYNDAGYGEYHTQDGHVLQIGPNVCLRPTTYSLGITAEYAKILEIYQSGIDIL